MSQTLDPAADHGAEINPANGSESKDAEQTRVLVADGNATVCKILRHTFTGLGWETREARDGEEALQLAAARPLPHAILLDLNVAKLDGYEVCRQLKADPQLRIIPIVVMTSQGSHEEVKKAVDAGADEFLSKPINRAELTVRVRSLTRMHRFNQELIGAESVAFALARAVASKDGYSSGHVEEVANYAASFGQDLGLDLLELKILKYGAILHNVGKISIPDAILEKTSALTPRERALFQQHPRVGCDICSPLKPLKPVLPIIRHHKEHWDGTGYPDSLSGNDIPLGAQIVGIVDVYSALTNDRPFRKAKTPQEAISFLRERARKGMHNPELVDKFITFIEAKCELVPTVEDAPAQEALPKPTPRTKDAVMSTNNIRVLVAEDNPGLARVLQFKLKHAGYDVTVSPDGTAAWDELQRETYDVLLTDFEMPGLTGGDLVRKMRQLPQYETTLVIMVTGRQLELDIRQLQDELKLTKVFPKPYSPTELLATLREYITANATADAGLA